MSQKCFGGFWELQETVVASGYDRSAFGGSWSVRQKGIQWLPSVGAVFARIETEVFVIARVLDRSRFSCTLQQFETETHGA